MMAVFEEFGILRDIALSFIVVAVVFSVEFALYFFREWHHSKNRTFNDLRFAWSIFLISMALNMSFFIMSDFYSSGEERLMWIKFGYVALFMGLTVFSNIQERALPWNTHGFFTILGISGIIGSLIIPHDILKYIAPFFYTPLFISLFAVFSAFILKRSSGVLRFYSFLLILGFAISITGYGLTIDIAVESIGVISYTIGAIFMVIGVVIMSFSVMNIPSFGELDWNKKIRNIILLSPDGHVLIHLTNRNAVVKTDDKSEKSFSGDALKGIINLIQEVTMDKDTVDVIDHGDVKINLLTGSSFELIVITTEMLQVVRKKMEEFTTKFENLYKDVLNEYSMDNLSMFKPAEAMMKQIFEISS